MPERGARRPEAGPRAAEGRLGGEGRHGRRPGRSAHGRCAPGVRKSTGCRTQGDAIAWRRRYLKADQDPAGEAARTVTLRDVLNDFLESRAAHTKNNGRPLSKDT